MVLDVFKILIEEDNKLIKLASNILKGSLVVIGTVKLYQFTVGNYHVMDVLSFAEWTEFVVSGRILVCLFLMAIVHFILFRLLKPFTLVAITWFAKAARKFKIENSVSKSIPKILDKFELIKIENDSQKVSVARNTEEFYEFVKAFKKTSTKKDLREIKDAYIDDIWHPYLLFVAYYFIYLRTSIDSGFVTFCIIFGILSIFFMYGALIIFSEYLTKSSHDLLFGLQGLRYQALAIEHIKDTSGFIHKPSTPLGYDYYFSGSNKKYVLQFYYSKRPIRQRIIEKLENFVDEENTFVLLISNQPATVEALDKCSSGRIKLICAENEKSLKKQLTTFLQSEYINE